MKVQYFIKQNVLLFLVILLASFAFLSNLGGQGYSLDEPQTVTIARTILTFGYPSAWDGKLFITGANWKDFTVINGRYFWTWQPWLPYYLVAPFYFFFGNSVTMLRFPFALLGVITVIVFYQVAYDIFKQKWLAAMLSVQLIFLMPFFLYIRQIRYYSPAALISVLLFWLLLRFVENKFNKKHLFVFLIAGLLLFTANYLIWLSCLSAFFLIALLKKTNTVFRNMLYRLDYLKIDLMGLFTSFYAGRLTKYSTKPIILTMLFESFLAFLWFLIFAPYRGDPSGAYFGRPVLFLGIIKYLSYYNSFIFPFLLFPLTFFAAWKLRMLTSLWLAAFWIGAKLVAYSLLVNPHGRYLVDVMPISLLFFGFVYSYLWTTFRQAVLILLLAFTVTTTNILSFVPATLWSSHQQQFRFYPQAFVTELTGSYPPAYLKLSAYLARLSKPGDLFWSNYSGWDIYLYSGVPMFTTPAACDAKTKPAVRQEANAQQRKIKWLLFYQGWPQSLNTDPCFGQKWQEKIERQYVKRIFPLDGNYYAINDPDIVNRQFPPPKTASDVVVIYERK